MGAKLQLLVLVALLTFAQALSVVDPKLGKEKSQDKINSTLLHNLDYEYPAQHSEEEVKPDSPSGRVLVNESASDEWSNSDEYYDDDDDWNWIVTHQNLTQEEPAKSAEASMLLIPTETKADDLASYVAPEKKQEVKEEDEMPSKAAPEKSGDDQLTWDDSSEETGVNYVDNLPTDNDADAEKYFDPERYHDKILLHQMEDVMGRQWTVLYEDSKIPCIMLRGHVKFVVPVTPTWFNKDFLVMEVPYDAEASGHCASLNNDYQELILKWNASLTEGGQAHSNSITFGFATNWTSEFADRPNVPEGSYAVVSVTAQYYNAEIDAITDNGLVAYSVSDLIEFVTPLNQSMSCLKSKTILVGSMELSMSEIQLEAFRPNSETLSFGDFSPAVLCSTDETIVFDAVMTFVIWGWIGLLIVVLAFFIILLLALSYRRRCNDNGFGYKILQA